MACNEILCTFGSVALLHNWNGCPLSHMLPVCNVTGRFQCNDAHTHTHTHTYTYTHYEALAELCLKKMIFLFLYKSKLVMSILWDIVVYNYVNFKGLGDNFI